MSQRRNQRKIIKYFELNGNKAEYMKICEMSQRNELLFLWQVIQWSPHHKDDPPLLRVMRGELIALNTDTGKQEKSQISDLSFYQKKLVKDEINPKKKRMLKSRNQQKMGKLEKIKETKSYFRRSIKCNAVAAYV